MGKKWKKCWENTWWHTATPDTDKKKKCCLFGPVETQSEEIKWNKNVINIYRPDAKPQNFFIVSNFFTEISFLNPVATFFFGTVCQFMLKVKVLTLSFLLHYSNYSGSSRLLQPVFTVFIFFFPYFGNDDIVRVALGVTGNQRLRSFRCGCNKVNYSVVTHETELKML